MGNASGRRGFRPDGDDGPGSSDFFFDRHSFFFGGHGNHGHHGDHDNQGHGAHGFHIEAQGSQWVLTNGVKAIPIAGNSIVLHGETYLLADHFGQGYQTVQAAIDAATGGETVLVATGTYNEQLLIAGAGKDGLTVAAALGSDVTIGAPATLVKTADDPNTGRDIYGLVTVQGADDVTIKGLTVDGGERGGEVGPGSPAPTMAGIVFIDSDGGVIDGDTVTGVRDPDAQFGAQRGVGIYVTNTDASPALPHTPSAAEADALNSIEIRNSTIEDFQKAGIRVSFADADIHDNTITGYGATPNQAQNGIQVTDSTGSIDDNVVSAIGYTGANWAASGILTIENRDLSITDNTVTGTGSTHLILGIAQIDSVGGRIAHNTISSVGWALDVEDYPGVYYPDPMEAGHPWGSSYNYSSNTLSDIGYNGVWFQPDAASTDAFHATGTTADDVMFGASANDVLNGGKGADYLFGEGGDDKLTGGAGGDVLDGGLGADRFIFHNVGESAPGAGNFDTIDDFTQGDDKIDLSVIDAKTGQFGNQAFGFVAAETTAVEANKVTWYQDVLNDETIVQADNNGNTVADLQIHLQGLITLTSSDFLL